MPVAKHEKLGLKKLHRQLRRLLANNVKKYNFFLHCLPRGDEVEEEVFLGKNSHVWRQAMNRAHVQKSILLYCLGKLR